MYPPCDTNAPFLQLPAELRFEIYDYLGPWEPKSYPSGRLIISSIDRRAPPTALMATCRYLYNDILDHFYNTVTFRTAPQRIPGHWSAHADPITLLALRRVRKIELRLCWDIRHKNRPVQGLRAGPGRLDSMILFLRREAKSLQTIIVSLTDLLSLDWEVTKELLAPLKELVPRVVLRLGEVVSLDDKEEFRERLQLYLEALNEALPPPVKPENQTSSPTLLTQ